jgi:uncharacterized protein
VIIDVNANISRWPLRRTPCDELPAMLASMKRNGVERAWVANLDGVLHRDVGGVNLRLAQECRPHAELLPFGTVNPMLPDWQEDLRRCHEEYHMPGIRLHPSYHGYKLSDPVFGELLNLAQRRGLIVELAVRMDDPRTQHPLLLVADVDLAPLAGVLAGRKGLRLVLLNAAVVARGPVLKKITGAGNVCVEIATKEGLGGVADLIKTAGVERVLFGSHLPLFPLESATLKMREADLTAAEREAVQSGNARRLLGR